MNFLWITRFRAPDKGFRLVSEYPNGFKNPSMQKHSLRRNKTLLRLCFFYEVPLLCRCFGLSPGFFHSRTPVIVCRTMLSIISPVRAPAA